MTTDLNVTDNKIIYRQDEDTATTEIIKECNNIVDKYFRVSPSETRKIIKEEATTNAIKKINEYTENHNHIDIRKSLTPMGHSKIIRDVAGASLAISLSEMEKIYKKYEDSKTILRIYSKSQNLQTTQSKVTRF